MKLIPAGVTQTIARQLLIAKKNSPRVMFVAGVTGVIASTFLACRATLRLNDALDEMDGHVLNVKNSKKEREDDKTYTDRDYYKDVLYVYGRGSFNIAKLYAPSIVVGTLSLTALTGSHIIMTRRNAGLTAAYAAVSKSFDDYRDRVKKELGEEKEHDIRFAKETVKSPEDGVTDIETVDPNKWSPYARFFDAGNANWTKDAELNRIFLQLQQNYCNHLLQSRGHVFLNEVYDQLGLERSRAGQVVGWVVGNGDGYIDFGMFTAHSAEFINGYEPTIILDFNVDGVIYNKI